MRAGAALQSFTPEHISVYSIYSSVPSVPLRLPPKKMKMDFLKFFLKRGLSFQQSSAICSNSDLLIDVIKRNFWLRHQGKTVWWKSSLLALLVIFHSFKTFFFAFPEPDRCPQTLQPSSVDRDERYFEGDVLLTNFMH